MDQTTPNGSGKSSWRDRLGLGNKEIPKIADQFKPPGRGGATEPVASAKVVKPSAAAPALGKSPVVAKPAPMAPRPAAATGAKSAQGSSARPAITPQNGPTLADRLKSQREAAEKLAEQRVEAARDKAKEVPAANGAVKPAEAAGRPKFTFAEEDAKPEAKVEAPPAYKPIFQAKPVPPTVQPPPIIPPRPALGGERPLPPSASGQGFDIKPRPAAPSFPPLPAAGGYRPIDPPGGLPPRPNGGPGRYSPPGYSDPQLAARRDAYENYRRSAPASGESDIFRDDARRPRAPMPAVPRQRDDDGLGDVFADEAPPPRRRASAKEYRQAYDDYDQGYEGDDGRRSKGPWLILLSMLVLAGLAGGGYWYWNTYLKGPMTAAAPAGEVPVVKAPETAAKTEPEPLAANGTGDTAPAAKSKQIYDRILGEQTIDGNQIVPTEEAPVAPDSQMAPKTGANDGADDPAAAAAPADATQIEPAGTNQSGAADEPLPLPLPPPPGDTGSQGSLPDVPGAQQAALATKSGIPEPAGTGTADSDLRIPETPTADAPLEETTPVEAVKKPVKKAQSAAKAKAKAAAAKARKQAKPAAESAGPVVLVPPADAAASDVAAAQIGGGDAAGAPRRTGSLFSGAGNENSAFKRLMREKNGSTTAAAAPADAAPAAGDDATQVASLEPEDAPAAKKPAPEAKATGNGYMVQLGSFSSRAEALAEMDRLKARHGGIIGGMPVRISEASVAGSTRYRAAVGPANSLDQGNRICSSLFAAGERDCLVRRQ